MNERMVKANGVDTCTEAFGDPNNPALFLIMGANSSMLWWEEDLSRRLADGGRYVIRYDNRDTGRSTAYTPYAPPYTVEDLAADAVGVLDAYGIERAHIAGFCLGGMIVQQLAIRHPFHVITATPMATSPDPTAIVTAATKGHVPESALPPPTQAIIELSRVLAAVNWSDEAAAIEAWVAGNRVSTGPCFPFDEAGSRDPARQQVRRVTNIVSHRFNHPIAIGQTRRWRDRLGEIRVPALVIHGTEDSAFPLPHGIALANEFPARSSSRSRG